MANYVTDEDLYGAVDRCARKLLEMAADAIGDPNKTPPGSLPRTVLDSLRLDAEDFMFYDPAKLDEEYTRLLDIAKAIGSDPYAAADLEETKNHLINWTGDAATAFKRQIDLMKEYCDLQQFNILQALQGLLAAGQLAVNARADCLELMEATIAAAEHEIGEQSKRAATATVAVASEIVEYALNLDAKSLISGTMTLFTKVGSEVAQAAIEGDDADMVVDNYLREKSNILGRYENALHRLDEALRKRIDEVVRDGQPLKEPLPTYCHVDSPDFSYERFQSTRDGGSAQVTPVVEEERTRYVEEKKSNDSEIGRRLGGDKGAV